MEGWEQMDKPLRDLIEIIHFTENVSAKIHGMLDEAEIYRAVKEEFAQSKRYTASILLLTDDGSSLRIAESLIPPGQLKASEKATGLQLRGYKIDLKKSSIYSQVVREGKTVQVNVSDTIAELFPRPLAHLISKTMGYEKKSSILTPLKRHGKTIGALAMSSTDLVEHFIPSVRNLAQRISAALELADEYAERKRAEEALRRAHDELEMGVQERTAELAKANEALQVEVTERRRAEQLLQALNQAALAMEQALTPEEIFAAVAEMFKKLGFSCAVLLTDGGQSRLFPKYLSHKAGAIKAAEKLVGLEAEDFSIPVETVDLYRKVVRERKTVFVENAEEGARQVLPERAKRFAGQIARMLKISKSIRAPLIVEDKVIGLLSVHSDDLSENDVPAITAFAHQMAAVWRKAKLMQDLERSLTERKRAEEALQQPGAILGAIAHAAEKFLRPSDWEQDIQAVLAYLGKAADVNRASIWEASTSEDGKYLISGRYEWIAPEAKLAALVGLQNVPVFRRWRDLIPRGEIIAGHVRDFSAKEQEFFVPRGIKSVLTVPIFVHGVWWGFMGFDQGGTEREWTEAEIDTLKTAASILGGALERKRAEEALQESEENFRALAENANDGIMIATGKGAHVYANRRMAEITGYSVPELLKTTIADLVHPDELKKVMERYQKRLEGKPAPRQYEIVFIRKDGKSVPLEMTSAKTVWRGQPAAIVVFRDITERKRAEKALERRTTQLQVAAEVSHAASSILNPDELIQRAVNLVRERFDLYYAGLFLVDQTGEWTGEPGKWAVLRADTGEAGRKMVEQGHRLEVGGESMIGWCVANKQARITQHVGEEAMRFDNPLLPETRSELALPLISRGQVIGAMTIQSAQEATFSEEGIAVFQTMANQLANAIANARLYDQAQQEITERKRAEEQLQRYAAELEQANEEIKQFAYIVSHDLRAPLTNLRGFSEELRYALEVIGSAMNTALPHLDEKERRAVTTALQEDVPEALGFIESSVTRMDNFINAVLKLSRLGRRELKFDAVDMDALVQATLQTLAHQIEERQVKVSVGSLPEVVADRTSIEQVIGNLLSNAVLYLDPGRPGEIEVTAERGHDETTFHVRDNGRGIAEEDMPKVFAPFRRAGKQDVPGEGMGLAYVQVLVRRHGGRIWCESEPGVGTTFTFTVSNHPTK